MNRRGFITSLLLLPAIPAAAIAGPDDTAAAQLATQDWLRKLDAKDFAGTWATAASIFKESVSKEAWSQAAQSVRTPLGSIQSRTEKSATFTRSLPGLPVGQYVVIQFDSLFEGKAKKTEVVTVALDCDGTWRVSGYFIQ